MRIAVIGTGISGLSAAWLLHRRHEVHVFERRARLGGHTHTAVVRGSRATSSGANLARRRRDHGLAVDTGFIVYNEVTYPDLTRLFDTLEIATAPSDMSWSLRCARCDLEYAGNPRGLAAQPGNLADPSYLRFVADIARFHRIGKRLVGDPRTREVPLGRFLRDAGFGHGFRNHYLLPMAAAIWSSGMTSVERFPLGTLLRFFHNHGLLGVRTHHRWRTVVGGASRYIPALTAGYRERIHTGDAVVAVERDAGGVDVRLDSGETHRMDAIVIATHADEALGLLANPSREEKDLLGAWTYSDNDAWLHTDTDLLPRRQAARASWNYLLDDCRRPGERVSLSYHMNRLQDLGDAPDHVVTLNPSRPPAAASVRMRTTYRHPTYTPEAVATQPVLDELNGRRRTFFAGAYQRYGFHEDGLWSALRVAAHLGVGWPV